MNDLEKRIPIPIGKWNMPGPRISQTNSQPMTRLVDDQTDRTYICIKLVTEILEVSVTSHAQIRHIVLGCLASFSLFIMFNLCACNICENRRTITKFSEST